MTMIDDRPVGAMKAFPAWQLIEAFDFDEAEEDWKAAQGDDGFIDATGPIKRVVVVHLPNYDEADIVVDGVLKRVARWALRVDVDDVR